MKTLFRKYVLFLFLVCNISVAANSPDRSFTERVLKENLKFLEFLNISISNFGQPDEIDTFNKSAMLQYEAHKLFLRGRYKESFEKIRDSQEILKDLYVKVINDHYQKDAEALLHRNSAAIVLSRDERAIHLLKLGYRDLKVSEIVETKGKYHNKFLYSSKIHFFIETIKYARQCKRYAFLAIIESQTPVEDKPDFQVQTLDDVLNKEQAEIVTDYERVKNKLMNLINRKMITDNYNFMMHLADNYGYIFTNRKDLYKGFISSLSAL